MKLKEKIYLSMQNIKTHRKLSFLTIFVTTLLLFLILLAFTIVTTVNYTVDIIINNSFLSNKYSLVSNYNVENKVFLKEYISKIDHVIEVYDDYEDGILSAKVLPSEILNENWEIELNGSSNLTLPTIIYGSNFDNDTVDVAVCPIRLLTTGMVNDYFVSKENYIDGKELLGKTITIEYDEYYFDSPIGKGKIVNNHKKNFRIIGLYDSSLLNISDNICFVHYEDMKKMLTIQNGNINDFNTPNSYTNFDIIIDNSKNLSYIKEQLNAFAKNNKVSIDLIASVSPDTEVIESITTSMTIFSIILVVLFIICFLVYIIKNVERRKKEIGLYKAMGYKNKQIYDIVLIEQCFIVTISFINAIILLLFGIFIFKIIASNYFYAFLKFSINIPFLYFLAIYILVIILTYFISLIALKKISKVEATIIMNE